MDLEGQGRIRRLVEQAGTENVVAILGANSAPAVEMAALALKSGDPSYAGPLAGVSLGIPAYHVLEPEITAQVDPAVYERELALPAMAMDLAEVVGPLKAIRGSDSQDRRGRARGSPCASTSRATSCARSSSRTGRGRTSA